MHFRTFARAMAAGLALAACESSTGSEPMEGTYVLQAVEGQPLPAGVDTSYWSDGVTYTVDRVVGRSVEFLDRDNVQYALSDQTTTYFPAGDSARAERCISMRVPYRVQGSRLLLLIEPALYGQTGPLRLDTLQIEPESLVQNIRTRADRTVRLEYEPAGESDVCAAPPS